MKKVAVPSTQSIELVPPCGPGHRRVFVALARQDEGSGRVLLSFGDPKITADQAAFWLEAGDRIMINAEGQGGMNSLVGKGIHALASTGTIEVQVQVG